MDNKKLQKSDLQDNDENIEKQQVLQEIEILGTSVHAMLTRELRLSKWENKLSTNQQLLLYLIGKRNINSVKDLAYEIGVSPSAVSQMIAKLEKMNLLKRTIDNDNRRNVCVELESGGVALLAEVEQVRAAIFSKYFSQIDIEDLMQIKDIYDKFYKVILQEKEG